jgi:hypothetical protein
MYQDNDRRRHGDKGRRPQPRASRTIEENLDLKRTLFRVLLAGIPVLLMPLCARSQAAPSEGKGPADQSASGYRYEAYAGFGYTSLNQVNQSRYGLIGVNLALTRDWGRFFGLSGKVNYYKPPLEFGNSTSTTILNGTSVTVPNGNPGDPSIYEVLVFPEIHANLYGPVGGFFHGGMGVEHTGGESETPNLSFAGGLGGGLTYDLTPHFAIRAFGDRIGAAFSVRNNSTELGNSPHRTWNSSGTIGLVYRF